MSEEDLQIEQSIGALEKLNEFSVGFAKLTKQGLRKLSVERVDENNAVLTVEFDELGTESLNIPLA